MQRVGKTLAILSAIKMNFSRAWPRSSDVRLQGLNGLSFNHDPLERSPRLLHASITLFPTNCTDDEDHRLAAQMKSELLCWTVVQWADWPGHPCPSEYAFDHGGSSRDSRAQAAADDPLFGVNYFSRLRQRLIVSCVRFGRLPSNGGGEHFSVRRFGKASASELLTIRTIHHRAILR